MLERNEGDPLLPEDNEALDESHVLAYLDTFFAAIPASIAAGYSDVLVDYIKNGILAGLVNLIAPPVLEGAAFGVVYFLIKYEMQYQNEKKENPSLERKDFYYQEKRKKIKTICFFPVFWLMSEIPIIILYELLRPNPHPHNKEAHTGELIQTGLVGVESVLQFAALSFLTRFEAADFPLHKLVDLGAFLLSAPLSNFLISKVQGLNYFDYSTLIYYVQPLLPVPVAACSALAGNLATRAYSACHARLWPSHKNENTETTTSSDLSSSSDLIINDSDSEDSNNDDAINSAPTMP